MYEREIRQVMKLGASSLAFGAVIGTSNVALYVAGLDGCLLHLTLSIHRDDNKSDSP